LTLGAEKFLGHRLGIFRLCYPYIDFVLAACSPLLIDVAFTTSNA